MRRDNSTHRSRFRRDERAVSTAVGYVLSLAIMTLLISGLLIAGGGFLEGQSDRITRDQLTVLGERVAAGVEDVDRMAGAGSDEPTVRLQVSLPARTAGSNYRIGVENTSDDFAADRPYAYDLVLEAPANNIERRIPIRTHHEVYDEQTVTGGDVIISYRDADGDGDHELVIHR